MQPQDSFQELQTAYPPIQNRFIFPPTKRLMVKVIMSILAGPPTTRKSQLSAFSFFTSFAENKSTSKPALYNVSVMASATIPLFPGELS
jgi:hypothetical protein